VELALHVRPGRGVDDLAKSGVGELRKLPADAGRVADHGLEVDVLEQPAVAVGEVGDMALEGQQVALPLCGECLQGLPPGPATGHGVD